MTLPRTRYTFKGSFISASGQRVLCWTCPEGEVRHEADSFWNGTGSFYLWPPGSRRVQRL